MIIIIDVWKNYYIVIRSETWSAAVWGLVYQWTPNSAVWTSKKHVNVSTHQHNVRPNTQGYLYYENVYWNLGGIICYYLSLSDRNHKSLVNTE